MATRMSQQQRGSQRGSQRGAPAQQPAASFPAPERNNKSMMVAHTRGSDVHKEDPSGGHWIRSCAGEFIGTFILSWVAFNAITGRRV